MKKLAIFILGLFLLRGGVFLLEIEASSVNLNKHNPMWTKNRMYYNYSKSRPYSGSDYWENRFKINSMYKNHLDIISMNKHNKIYDDYYFNVKFGIFEGSGYNDFEPDEGSNFKKAKFKIDSAGMLHWVSGTPISSYNSQNDLKVFKIESIEGEDSNEIIPKDALDTFNAYIIYTDTPNKVFKSNKFFIVNEIIATTRFFGGLNLKATHYNTYPDSPYDWETVYNEDYLDYTKSVRDTSCYLTGEYICSLFGDYSLLHYNYYTDHDDNTLNRVYIIPKWVLGRDDNIKVVFTSFNRRKHDGSHMSITNSSEIAKYASLQGVKHGDLVKITKLNMTWLMGYHILLAETIKLDLDDGDILSELGKVPEYKNKIQELTQNLTQANRDKQTLESQKSAIQSKLNQILNSAKAISPNVTEDTLNQYLRDLQNQKSTLEQEKTTLENSVQSLTNEKQALERNLQNERERNNRNTLEITRLSSDLELNKRRIADLESQITNKNQEIERLNLRYETLNNSVMDLKSLLESKGIQNVGNTNLEVLEASKRELNRLLSNDLRLQQIQEELKILGINKTDTREVIEELNSRSKTLERIDKILSGESWLENTTDKVKLLEDIKRQVKEVLKQAKKENIPQVVEELKRLQEIEKKYNSLVKTLVGDDLTLNPQTRAEELVQKESEYKEIKQAFENKTKDEILNRIQELNSAESELKKIQNKAKTLKLDHTKIDKILEDLVKRKNQLENILKGLGGLGNIELTEENLKKIIADLIQQKKDLEQAKAEAQKLGLDITSIKDLISKLDKGNKDLQSLLEKNQKLLRDTENELRNRLSEISDLKRLVKSLQDELDKLKKKDLENTNKIQDLIANSDSIKTSNLLSDLNSLDGSFTRGEIAKVFYKHSNLVNKNIDESNLPDNFVRVNKFKDTDDFYIDFLRSKYITVGIGNEQFGANKELDNNMLGAFALRYNGIYDFDYKKSFSLAREKGLLSKDSYKNKLEIAEDIARWK